MIDAQTAYNNTYKNIIDKVTTAIDEATNICCFSCEVHLKIPKILEPRIHSDIVTKLQESGYTVTINNKYICIEWL